MKEDAQPKRAYNRAPGQRQLSISIPIALVNQIDKIATAERRSRSAMISLMLEAEIAFYERQHVHASPAQGVLLVAENRCNEYGNC